MPKLTIPNDADSVDMNVRFNRPMTHGAVSQRFNMLSDESQRQLETDKDLAKAFRQHTRQIDQQRRKKEAVEKTYKKSEGPIGGYSF